MHLMCMGAYVYTCACVCSVCVCVCVCVCMCVFSLKLFLVVSPFFPLVILSQVFYCGSGNVYAFFLILFHFLCIVCVYTQR